MRRIASFACLLAIGLGPRLGVVRADEPPASDDAAPVDAQAPAPTAPDDGSTDAPSDGDVRDAPVARDAPTETDVPPEEPSSPVDEDPIVDDAGDVRVRRDAADASLEDLLGLDLADTLGSTSAASRSLEALLAAPATITTLEADAIRASGARTLPDLLRFVPGVQVSTTAPGSFVVSLRGMHGVVGNNVVVTLEGVPLNNPLDGSVEWSALPIDVRDLERIEVVRGPVSAIYGANAYSGVINLIAHRGYGDLPLWSVRASGSLDDRARGAAQLAFRWSRRSGGREFALLGTGSYDALFASGNPAMANGGLLGRFGVDVGGGRFEAQVGVATLRRSSLEHLSLDRVVEPRHVATARLQYTSPELPGVLEPLSVWARALDHRVPDTGTDPAGFSYAGTNAFRTNLGADLPLRLHDTLRLTIGGDLAFDAVRARYVQGGEDGLLRAGYGAYVQARFDPHPRFTLSAAARVDRPTVDPTPLLSYRAAAVYHTDALSIRASASSSFRAPTYVERLGRFVDPAQGILILEGSELEAPRNTSFEASVTYSPHVDVRLGASAYATRLSQLVIEDVYTIPRKTFLSDDDPRWLGGAEIETSFHVVDALEIEAAAAFVVYFTEEVGDQPTVAVRDQNSRYTASLRARGSVLGDRLRYGFGTAFASRRAYAGAVGVPWAFLREVREPIVLLDGTVEQLLPTRVPLSFFARAQVNPLGRTAQTFLPGGSVVGSSFTLGLELRRD